MTYSVSNRQVVPPLLARFPQLAMQQTCTKQLEHGAWLFFPQHMPLALPACCIWQRCARTTSIHCSYGHHVHGVEHVHCTSPFSSLARAFYALLYLALSQLIPSQHIRVYMRSLEHDDLDNRMIACTAWLTSMNQRPITSLWPLLRAFTTSTRGTVGRFGYPISPRWRRASRRAYNGGTGVRMLYTVQADSPPALQYRGSCQPR